MDTEERKILDIIVVLSKETNDRIVKFTRYLLILLVIVIIGSGTLLYGVVKTNNETLRECTRLYFETDYLYPETDITQNQTIGDIK